MVSITDLIGNASEGDFSKTADESNKTELGILAHSFNKMTRKISNILTKTALFSGEVIQSSGKLKDIEENIGTISEALHEISDGTVAQNGEVNHVVQRAAQLDETLSQVRKQSRQLLENAKNTMQSGEKGALHVHNLMKQNEKTTDMMDLSYQQIITLEQQSRKISNIVNTINEISTQTELLALNASIEAARAGEHGKGFAVVAESIGKLASDSTRATADIGNIIDSLCKDIADTVVNIQEIKDGIMGQAGAVDTVQSTFEDFKVLAEETQTAVSEMEKLVENMHKCDRSMVHAVERIRDTSHNTEVLTEKVSGSLEEQLEGIHLVSQRIDALSAVSREMEEEMTKFKL